MKGNKHFVNEFNINDKVKKELINGEEILPKSNGSLGIKGLSNKFIGLLSDKEIKLILDDINNQEWIPVGIDGMKGNYKEGDAIGSYRLSCYEPDVAEVIWNRIKDFIPEKRSFDDNCFTDWDSHEEWKPIGINPLFRFIRYTDKGVLVPHYDGSFIQNDNVRSLGTLVIYIENEGEGGSTRFILDEQDNMKLENRDLSDWISEANNEHILSSVDGSSGEAIMFDHFILHDSEKMLGGKKTIIRTDIMYEKIY